MSAKRLGQLSLVPFLEPTSDPDSQPQLADATKFENCRHTSREAEFLSSKMTNEGVGAESHRRAR